MAVEDLFQLSAQLQAQLPILFSFAVLRWTLGHLCGGVGAWTMRRVGGGRHVPSVVFFLQQLRAWLYLLTLLASSAAWAHDGVKNGLPQLCGTQTNPRVQGLVCCVGLTVLMTSGNALALGMALATLMAVSDLAACSMLLASTTVLFAVKRGGIGKLIASSSMIFASLVGRCWSDDDEQRPPTEAAVLALVLMSVYMCVRVTVLSVRVACRVGASLCKRMCSFPRRAGRLLYKERQKIR